MMVKSWEEIVNELGGSPYVIGGNGPDSYDCWSLVKAASNMRGVHCWLDDEDALYEDLAAAAAHETASSHWAKVEEPEAGDVCMMTSFRNLPHIGIVTPYGVLHTTAKLGAAIMPEASLRLSCYRDIRYYRWAG